MQTKYTITVTAEWDDIDQIEFTDVMRIRSKDGKWNTYRYELV